jgi:hypothetical protein
VNERPNPCTATLHCAIVEARDYSREHGMLPLYDILKDFASPILNFITAIIAATVAIRFGSLQAQIGKAQRDISLDKLKFDLFAKRYEIYEAAKHLIEHLAMVSDVKKQDPAFIRQSYVRMDEARFFYGPDICAFLARLQDASEAFLTLLGERENISLGDNDKWADTADRLASRQKHLREIYASLPTVFEATLSFDQLKRERAV